MLRQTMRKRWQAKLKAVKAELKNRLHDPIPEVGKYLRAVVLGHVRYYGVPINGPAICSFRRAIGRVWCRVLRREAKAITCLASNVAGDRNLASACSNCHRPSSAWALTQGGSRMR